jgi:hypothetical protein
VLYEKKCRAHTKYIKRDERWHDKRIHSKWWWHNQRLEELGQRILGNLINFQIHQIEEATFDTPT